MLLPPRRPMRSCVNRQFRRLLFPKKAHQREAHKTSPSCGSNTRGCGKKGQNSPTSAVRTQKRTGNMPLGRSQVVPDTWVTDFPNLVQEMGHTTKFSIDQMPLSI